MRLFLIVFAVGLALGGAALDIGWIGVDDPHPLGLGLLSLAAFYASGLTK